MPKTEKFKYTRVNFGVCTLIMFIPVYNSSLSCFMSLYYAKFRGCCGGIALLFSDDWVSIDVNYKRSCLIECGAKSTVWYWTDFMVTPCINNIHHFNLQLMHTTLKNVELLKHRTIVIIKLILKCSYNSTFFFNVVYISWKLKCWVLNRHFRSICFNRYDEGRSRFLWNVLYIYQNTRRLTPLVLRHYYSW